MTIYVHQQGLTLCGKAWEIKAKLKEAMKSYETVQEWRDAVYSVRKSSFVY